MPGFHYDEVWTGDLAFKIAFSGNTFPLFGMNHYTCPIMAYLLAAYFKLIGYPSLEGARYFYASLHIVSFFLNYLWVSKHYKQQLFIFFVVWTGLPFVIISHHLNLEVTTGYFFFGALTLWGTSEGILKTNSDWKSKLWSWIGLFSALLATYSHVLFIGIMAATILSALSLTPHFFTQRKVKFFTILYLILITPFLSNALFFEAPTSSKIKAACVVFASVFGCLILKFEFWRHTLISKALHLFVRLFLMIGAIGAFFFIVFQLVGVWPVFQITLQRPALIHLTGIFVAGCFLYLLVGFFFPSIIRYNQALTKSRSTQYFARAFLLCCAFTILSIFKPTSLRYWCGPFFFALLFTLSFTQDMISARPSYAGRSQRYLNAMLILLMTALTTQNQIYIYRFFAQSGAIKDTAKWLWVKDTSLDYRPMIPIYRALKSSAKICSNDVVRVDEFRNQFVLDVYRSFESFLGKELRCSETKEFYISKEGAPLNTSAERILTLPSQLGFGDFSNQILLSKRTRTQLRAR